MSLPPISNDHNIVVAPLADKKKKECLFIRVVKAVCRAVAAFFKAIGRFFQRLFGIGGRDKDQLPPQLQGFLNAFTPEEDIPDETTPAPSQIIDNKVSIISKEEDPELVKFVSQGERVIGKVVAIGLDKNLDKIDKLNEATPLLPKLGGLIPPLKEFFEEVEGVLTEVVDKKHELKEFIPKITETVGNRFLTHMALLLKGSDITVEGEKVSPYTQGFNEIINTFSAHLKHQVAYLKEVEKWDKLFARAEEKDNKDIDENIASISRTIEQLGRETAYQIGMILSYNATHSTVYTHKHIRMMIVKLNGMVGEIGKDRAKLGKLRKEIDENESDELKTQCNNLANKIKKDHKKLDEFCKEITENGCTGLKAVCKEMADQIMVSFYPEDIDDQFSLGQLIPKELEPLKNKGISIVNKINDTFGSNEKKYVKSITKSVLSSGIAYGLEKLFNKILEPNYLKQVLHKFTMAKVEEQIILSFLRQILSAQVDDFARLFTEEDYQNENGVTRESISDELHKSLGKKTNLYQLTQDKDKFREMIKPLFDEIDKHFKGQNIQDENTFKEGIQKLFSSEIGEKDENFVEIILDAVFELGELEVEGITGAFQGPLKKIMKSKLTPLISNVVQPYKKSPKKFMEIISDSIEHNLKDEDIEEIISGETKEINEEEANENLNHRIANISKIIHDLITWNLPTGWFAGPLAKKAVTQSLGNNEEKLVGIIKNVIRKVFGVTTQKGELAEGNKFTNQNLIFHIFDTTIALLQKSAQRVDLVAKVEPVIA